MPCESEFVEISMMVEISAKIFLGIISLLVRLLDGLIIFLISDRKISESAVVLGKRTCQREVVKEKMLSKNISDALTGNALTGRSQSQIRKQNYKPSIA